MHKHLNSLLRCLIFFRTKAVPFGWNSNFFWTEPRLITRRARGGSELNFTLVERGNSVGAFPLASAEFIPHFVAGLRRTKTEIFSLHFLFFRPPFFRPRALSLASQFILCMPLRYSLSFNRRWKIFCFGFLLIRGKRKRSNSNRKRAKIPSPQPPSFLPFCFSGFARFFCGAFIFLFF